MNGLRLAPGSSWRFSVTELAAASWLSVPESAVTIREACRSGHAAESAAAGFPAWPDLRRGTSQPVFPQRYAARWTARAPRWCSPVEPCPSRLRCRWPAAPNPAAARPTGRSLD